jgi:hypothetical protein
MRSDKLVKVLLIGLSISPILSANTITVGAYNNSTCFPFACAGGSPVTRYQQVYAASAFSTNAYIDNISFPVASSLNSNNVDPATFTVYLSTTPVAVGGLSSDLASNAGPDETFFGTTSIGPTVPNAITFLGRPFIYNPHNGNLLLDVFISGKSANPRGHATLEEEDISGTVTQSAYINGGPGVTSDIGLVTSFTAPEPGTGLIFSLTLVAGALGAICRRKRASRV